MNEQDELHGVDELETLRLSGIKIIYSPFPFSMEDEMELREFGVVPFYRENDGYFD